MQIYHQQSTGRPSFARVVLRSVFANLAVPHGEARAISPIVERSVLAPSLFILPSVHNTHVRGYCYYYAVRSALGRSCVVSPRMSQRIKKIKNVVLSLCVCL